MKGSIAILAGGGPAPGINSVISSIAKVFIKDGYKVIGLHQGYKTLFSDTPDMIEIDFALADRIHNQGGSALEMSRHKPKDMDFNTGFFIKNDIRLLVTIGGDDTASTANRISKFLISNDVKIQNIHVPKTIDNDLPLPDGIPTFGYQSAKQEGVRLATTVYEDARTSGNWFMVSAMGREAGHLAFGIGAACHYPMIIIPEMFNQTEVTFERILRLVVSSMIKRKILGISYGTAIVSEGVFHFMTDDEIRSSSIVFTFDEHGHPELGNVSKAHIFNMLLQRKVKELNLNIKSRPVELGYELRCVQPIAFDMLYCSLMGIGVKILFDEGFSGCMVVSGPNGDISALYLKDVEDENGKVKPRLVNMEGQKSKMVFNHSLQYIEPADYEAARKYVADPEYYDFRKILNWEPVR
ncbi:MAG: 6-phosphofructokinase [Lentimicrobium sp.]|jgi:6-phosphofructokinase 1|nr:6-phosphofructokinase [Lentimicrobium sp.]MDD2527242.1 6-phosphofructokinase [Lentimicrobiaceae bacterium]MDD4596578.1 6-phosphofructokinase [Lentimicrobiaceae bacterium]MDY0024873.1 6-phosphofructokinase [Lentimicrobium sp.]HAH58041.1 6-phosphofructokinase [Bacteroidales bacterium]